MHVTRSLTQRLERWIQKVESPGQNFPTYPLTPGTYPHTLQPPVLRLGIPESFAFFRGCHLGIAFFLLKKTHKDSWDEGYICQPIYHEHRCHSWIGKGLPWTVPWIHHGNISDVEQADVGLTRFLSRES